MALKPYAGFRRGGIVITRVAQRGTAPPVYEVEFQHGFTIQVHGGSGRSDTVYAMKPHDFRWREGPKASLGVATRRGMQYLAIQAVLGKLGNKSPATFFVDSDGDLTARVAGGVSRRGRGGAAGAVHALKAREAHEMAAMLKAVGYSSPAMHARKLVREGMGPTELAGRIRHGRGGVGSLEHSHGMRDRTRRGPRQRDPVRLTAAQKKALRSLTSGFGPLSYAERASAKNFHALGLLKTNNINDPSYVSLSPAGEAALRGS